MTTKKDEEQAKTDSETSKPKAYKKGEFNEQKPDLGTLAKEQRELDEQIRKGK